MSKGNYIGGKWVPGKGERLISLAPAAQLPIWEGNASNEMDVFAAVKAARAAFDPWRRLALDARLAIIDKYCDLLKAKLEGLTLTIATETGKTVWDSRGEVQAMIGKIGISLRAYNERTGEKAVEGAVRAVLRHQPHGVMAVFGPYNFPGHLPNGHIVPALIAGNTVVFKPSEQTPHVAEEMVMVWEEAGLPPGVLNLVQGARETGQALAGHDDIDGILFTGSAAVGEILHKQLAGKVDKMLALEMGGNNPLVVWEVKDLEAAAYLIVQSAFLSSGQRCTCARRLIIPEGKAGDAIVEALLVLAQRISVGAPADRPEPFMGPLISNREAERIVEAAVALEKAGGKVLFKTYRLREDFPFVSPGIIDVTKVKKRADTEYFGPLLQVIRARDFAAALAEANNTRFGLSAGLISDNAKLYEEFRKEVRAGVVNWNRPTNGASGALPFGGIGLSGNHRPSAYYAADYCAWPVASQESDKVLPPETPLPGIA